MFLKDVCNVMYPFVNFNSNIKNINDIVEKISHIKIHNLLQVPKQIRNQFKLLVYIHNFKKPTEKLSLYFFKKKYDTQKLKYHDYKVYFLQAFHLSDGQPPLKYDWKHIETDKKIFADNNENFLDNIDIDFDENDLELDRDMMYEHFKSFYDYFFFQYNDELDLEENNNLYELSHMHTGLYLNLDDIRWQAFIKDSMCSEIGNHGEVINYIKTDKFKKSNIKKAYFPLLNRNSMYERYMLKSFCITCDCCKKLIASNEEDSFYHFDDCGDICEICLISKKKSEEKRKDYLYKLLLLPGKRKLFNDELIKTKNFLKKYKYRKLCISKKYNVMKNINKEITKDNVLNSSTCPICFDLLTKDNICAGSCGHCFHINCIENNIGDGKNKCPICRNNTNFVKLFL